MREGWVYFTEWSKAGMMDYGEIRSEDLDRYINAFKVEAEDVLEETGADYVLYAVKHFESGKLSEIRFYEEPMTKERFGEVREMKDVEIFAVSKEEEK